VSPAQAEGVPCLTWQHLRKYLKAFLAERFGPGPELPDALGCLTDDGDPEAQPVCGQRHADGLLELLRTNPQIVQQGLAWYSENPVGDPLQEHLAFTKMSQAFRRQTRGVLFETLTQDLTRSFHCPALRRGTSAR
jgi:hypothetical protein